MVLFELRAHPSFYFILQAKRSERHFLKKDRTTISRKSRTSQEKPDNSTVQRQTQKNPWCVFVGAFLGWVLDLGNFGLPRSFWQYLVQPV